MQYEHTKQSTIVLNGDEIDSLYRLLSVAIDHAPEGKGFLMGEDLTLAKELRTQMEEE